VTSGVRETPVAEPQTIFISSGLFSGGRAPASRHTMKNLKPLRRTNFLRAVSQAVNYIQRQMKLVKCRAMQTVGKPSSLYGIA
jgi:hypothetical protein